MYYLLQCTFAAYIQLYTLCFESDFIKDGSQLAN